MAPPKKPLVPVDPRRCQAEMRTGSFMTLGPRFWDRCANVPTRIVVEIRRGPDGQHGAMSLCDSCTEVFKGKTPTWDTAFAFVPLQQAKKRGKRS